MFQCPAASVAEPLDATVTWARGTGCALIESTTIPPAAHVCPKAFPTMNVMYPAYNPQLTGTRVQWPESAALAAKIGFPGCDVAIVTAMKNGLETMRNTLAASKVRAAAVDLPVDFRKDDETFRAGLRLLPDASSFAAAIDCKKAVNTVY